MVDFSRVRFGRKPDDPTRVAAYAPHVMGAAPLPAAFPAQPIVGWKPTLGDNLTLPTCCVVGLGNSLRRWAAAQGFDITVEDQQLFDLYAAVNGCQATPEAIEATDGLVIADLLDYVSINGFRYSSDQEPIALTAAYRVDPGDLDAMRDVMLLRQSVYVGVDLYTPDLQPGAKWLGKPSGAVVGCHCIVPCRFAPDDWDDATWGEMLSADDDWMGSRVQEAYGLEWRL